MPPPHPVPPQSCILRALGEHALSVKNPAIVHVGANLAFQNHNDPLTQLIIQQPSLRVVLVEPQPHIAARLRNATRGYENVFVHQAAACRSDAANITFWEIDQSKLRGSEIWFVREQQIASLDRTHLLKHKAFAHNIAHLTRGIEVPCHSVRTILQLHAIATRRVQT